MCLYLSLLSELICGRPTSSAIVVFAEDPWNLSLMVVGLTRVLLCSERLVLLLLLPLRFSRGIRIGREHARENVFGIVQTLAKFLIGRVHGG